MAVVADQPVREQALDTSKSFLVQAPAGSGKTSLLTQRYLALLAQVQQAPEEILAITFTRKSAEEMRTRILNALLLAQAKTSPTDPYLLKLYTLARRVLERDQQARWGLLENPNRLQILTIDALCAKITKQMPVITSFGSQPDITADPIPLYRRAVARLLQEQNSSLAWMPSLQNLLLHLDNNRAKIIDLLTAMLPIREQWLPYLIQTMGSNESIRLVLEQGLQIVLEKALREFRLICINLLPREILILAKKSAELLLQMEKESPILACLTLAEKWPEANSAALPQWLGLIELLFTQDGKWRKTVTQQQGFPAPSSTADKELKQQLKSQKQEMLELLERLNKNSEIQDKIVAIRKLPPIHYTDIQWTILESLAVILPVVVAQLHVVFKESAQVDFQEVAISASYALGHPESASDLALALDYRVHHILVDEFQDTSVSQYKLLEKLTMGWDLADKKTLFLVGDPMQSIYRFRQADVSLFVKAKQNGIANIPLTFLQLTVNFRATPKIIDWVNGVFKQSFPRQEDMSLGAIAYTASVASQLNSIDTEVYYKIFEQETDEIYVEDMAVVEIIRKVRANNSRASIAILVRSRRHLTTILPLLQFAGISYQGIEIARLSDKIIIQDLLSLTKAILHLEDRIAWLAILRAPWCGLLLKDIYVIANQPMTIWDALLKIDILEDISDDAKLRIARFVIVMQRALRERDNIALYELIQQIWEQLGGKFCLEQNDSLQDTQTFFNFLAEHQDRREFREVGFLDSQLEKLYAKPDTLDPFAVQIMTIHKAKGLEFDVVILPGLGKKSVADKEQLLLCEQHYYDELPYFLMAPIRIFSEQIDKIYDYMKFIEGQRQQYESLRLLYVAATRAKKQLYCLGMSGKNGPIKNSLLSFIWDNYIHFATEYEIATNYNNNLNLPQNDALLRRLPSSWFEQNIISSPECLPITFANASEKTCEVWQDDWMRHVGIVVHRVLYQFATQGVQYWSDLHIEQQKYRWGNELKQSGVSKDSFQKAITYVGYAIRHILADDKCLWILSNKHQESYAEWPLMVKHYKGYKQIILDRAFLTQENEFWIVDYKLCLTEELEDLVQRYKPQLAQYAAAVKNLRSEVDVRTALYFPLQKHWVVLDKNITYVIMDKDQGGLILAENSLPKRIRSEKVIGDYD